MLKEAISDQKRFIRGEHWLRARYFLRARDGVHRRAWRLLTIAGPSPREEITCIREVMPDAHITAVDLDPVNLAAAIDAGIDEVIHCDIGDFTKEVTGNGYSKVTKYLPPTPLRDKKFDVFCLDLTGPSNDWLKQLVSVYFNLSLEARGILIVTFSYGRDVVERHHDQWLRDCNTEVYMGGDSVEEHLDKLPEPLAARVWYFLRTKVRHIESCVAYRGNKMPMVSCLLVKGRDFVPSFKAINPEDFRLAVTAENIGNIYACTADRIDALRMKDTRKEAARKAVETRKRRLLSPPTPLLTYKPEKQ